MWVNNTIFVVSDLSSNYNISKTSSFVELTDTQVVISKKETPLFPFVSIVRHLRKNESVTSIVHFISSYVARFLEQV